MLITRDGLQFVLQLTWITLACRSSFNISMVWKIATRNTVSKCQNNKKINKQINIIKELFHFDRIWDDLQMLRKANTISRAKTSAYMLLKAKTRSTYSNNNINKKIQPQGLSRWVFFFQLFSVSLSNFSHYFNEYRVRFISFVRCGITRNNFLMYLPDWSHTSDVDKMTVQ